jgi:hypothetical protein
MTAASNATSLNHIAGIHMEVRFAATSPGGAASEASQNKVTALAPFQTHLRHPSSAAPEGT